MNKIDWNIETIDGKIKKLIEERKEYQDILDVYEAIQRYQELPRGIYTARPFPILHILLDGRSGKVLDIQEEIIAWQRRIDDITSAIVELNKQWLAKRKEVQPF